MNRKRLLAAVLAVLSSSILTFAQTSVTIPKDMTMGVINYLNQFRDLEEVLVEEGHPLYTSNSGLLCTITGDTLVYVPYKYAKDSVLVIGEGIHVIPDIKCFANRSRVRRIELLDNAVTYAYLPLCQEMVFHQPTPPATLTFYGNSYPKMRVMYVPAGAGAAFYEKYKSFAIIEEGQNVERVNFNIENIKGENIKGFSSTSVYDLDGDGRMELVGYDQSYKSYDSKGELYNYIRFTFMNGDERVYRDSVTNCYLGFFYIIRGYGYTTGTIGGSHGNIQVERSPVGNNLVYKMSGNGEHIFTRQDDGLRYQGGLFVCDIDNDGRKDLITSATMTESEKAMTANFQLADGSPSTRELSVTNEEKEPTPSSGGTWIDMIRGWLRNSMFVDGGTTSVNASIKQDAVDLNGDGIRDLIGFSGLLYSYDDNKFYCRETNEAVYPYDIDGDGEVDYVCYDGSKLYVVTNLTGGEETRRDLYSNSRIDHVEFRDFDHDGDIDILAFLCVRNSNYNASSYNSYFVFLRNNGNGTFRRKEQNFAGIKYEFVECRDYDADGCYELNVTDGSKTTLMKVNADFTLTTVDELFTNQYGVDYSQLLLGDFTGDGLTEFYCGGGRFYGHLRSQTQPNTRPQKMAMPTAMFLPEMNRLKIAWQYGSDAETSSCDLTYELRIGTQPGLGDVLRAESTADGKRLTIREGNQGTMRQMLFNAAALKPGKYYIAVQAIDQGGLGGAFSDEFVYEHALHAPVFYASAESLTTADTLSVYVKTPLPSASYEWRISEGEIIEQTELGAKMVFHREGDHEIGLTMTLDGISYPATPQTVYVASMKKADFSLIDNPNYSVETLFDWNQDGTIDYTIGGSTIIIVKNNGDGTFDKVLLSTFADIGRGSFSTIYDFNRDGYPDMLSKSSKGNIFLNYGEQDFDFDYQTVGFNYTSGGYYTEKHPGGALIDLNNDGLMDCKENLNFRSTGSYRIIDGKEYSITNLEALVTDDGINYTSTVVVPELLWGNGEGFSNPSFYDVNRDGFPDIVYWKTRSKNVPDDTNKLYVCYKDSTRSFTYSEPQILFSMPAEKGYVCDDIVLADFNNDGYVDLAYMSGKETDLGGGNGTRRDYTLLILKGHPEGNSSEVVMTHDFGTDFDDWTTTLLDLNNDGFLDIPYIDTAVDRYVHNIHSLLIGPDFSYRMVQNPEIHHYSDIGDDIVPFANQGDILTGSTLYKTGIQNQPPAAPTEVSVRQTQNGMLITWSDAQDDYTPAMQMRYNISVKQKGKTGDGAFVISPLNGLWDEAAIVPGYDYKKCTQMLVPSTALTVGKTYEIQVQAIDLWGAHSPMTQVVEFTMGRGGYIEAPDRIAVDTETILTLHAAQAANYSINLGEGGSIVKDYGNGKYAVKWSTTGVKTYTITAGATVVTSQITVVKRVDVSFTLPSMILAGAPLTVNLSDEMAALSVGVDFKCEGAKVEYTPGAKTALVTFLSTGNYLLTASYDDAVRGNQYTRNVTVNNAMPNAEIDRVDIEGNSNYVVSWSQLPTYINKVIIEKESAQRDLFLPLDTINATTGTYTDLSSNAMIASCRYRLRLIATNGQTSTPGAPHTPMHIMLTYSPLGGYNLTWNAYEGLTVGTYTIWRGTDENNMSAIANVAGWQQSYTDLSAPTNGSVYYFVSFIPMTGYMPQSSRRAVLADDGSIKSNIISTGTAVNVVTANQVRIVAASEDLRLTDEQPALQLYSIVLPAYTTISRVAWSIVEGEEMASIDSRGLLTAYGGNGNVTVKATTLDGSGLSAELTIPVAMTAILKGDVNLDKAVDAADVTQTLNFILGKEPEGFSTRNADVNGDGEINVGDLNMIAGIIADGNNDAGSSSALLTCDLWDSLLKIDLWGQQNYTAFQMRLTTPQDIGREQVDMMLKRGTDHVLVTNWLSEHEVIIVAYSMSRQSFTGTEGTLLQLKLDWFSESDWLFDDIVFAHADGTTWKYAPLSINYATGVRGVQEQKPSDDDSIYDLSGRQIVNGKLSNGKLPRGIYIMNGKIVMVK